MEEHLKDLRNKQDNEFFRDEKSRDIANLEATTEAKEKLIETQKQENMIETEQAKLKRLTDINTLYSEFNINKRKFQELLQIKDESELNEIINTFLGKYLEEKSNDKELNPDNVFLFTNHITIINNFRNSKDKYEFLQTTNEKKSREIEQLEKKINNLKTNIHSFINDGSNGINKFFELQNLFKEGYEDNEDKQNKYIDFMLILKKKFDLEDNDDDTTLMEGGNTTNNNYDFEYTEESDKESDESDKESDESDEESDESGEESNMIDGITKSNNLLGGAPNLEVDKRADAKKRSAFYKRRIFDVNNLNLTEENFYNITHYYIDLTWPIYVILKMFINKNSLIKSFMNNYIKKIFELTNNDKLNAIKSSPDAYRSLSNILINDVFFDIIKNYIAKNEKYKDKDYNYIENDFVKISNTNDTSIDKLDKNNNVFIKLSFNQSELIKFLVDSFNTIPNLRDIVNQKDGIEKIRTMYSEKIKRILNIIESEEDVREKFNYINDDLNSIFNIQGTNILKPYRDTIKKIDKAIDDFYGPINSVLIDELLKSHLKGFKLENNTITIALDDIEFNDKVQGKQLEDIKEKIKIKEQEVNNLKQLLSVTGNEEE